MRILVTGVAGFIGFHTALRLLERGDEVVGVDNLSDYYDVALKQARLSRLLGRSGFNFLRMDLASRESVRELFVTNDFAAVVHLAAQAGVRCSIQNPHTYVDSNLVGFTNILEGCRHSDVEHLVFASSSSVYGANTEVPFTTRQNVDHPISLYAATKKANELLAHAYASLYDMPVTGLRFFTVYGPWGRPDMAPYIFTKAILEGRPIKIFNEGRMRRDFTYVDDVVECVVRVVDTMPEPDPDAADDPSRSSRAPYRVYNVGRGEPVELMRFVEIVGQLAGTAADKHYRPHQPGDMIETYADVDDLVQTIGFRPQTSLEDGMQRFVAWYREYHDAVAANGVGTGNDRSGS